MSENGVIRARRMAATPAADPEAAANAVVAVIRDLLSHGGPVQAVGVGAAGMVDRKGIMRYAPNVAWREFPLRQRVEGEIGLPTLVDNDANTAAWGEFRFGAGVDSTDMLLVTVGTGIGGGIVVGGRLSRGAHGFAGEIGHFIVQPGGPPCGCGNRGCWEQVASGRAIGRLGREVSMAHPGTLMRALASGDPQRVTGRIVTEAASRGDPLAIDVVGEVGRRLGEGIAGLVNVLDPQTVVVGGGAVSAGELILGPARAAFKESLEAPEHRPAVPILAARLGNDAGAVGAAALALEEAGE